MKGMLTMCQYEVTGCDQAADALTLLRGNRNGYDIVLTEVHMSGMDGFRLMENVELEAGIPVVLMSEDEATSLVMKGVVQGACDYLVKPVQMATLRNLWQHVVRKRRNDRRQKDSHEFCDGAKRSTSMSIDGWEQAKMKEKVTADVETSQRAVRKSRFMWTRKLHERLVTAVDCLGIDGAVPQKVLELMDVPGLTRENVRNRLRLYKRKLLQEQCRSDASEPFTVPPTENITDLSTFDALPPQQIMGSSARQSLNKSPAGCRNVLRSRNQEFEPAKRQHIPPAAVGKPRQLFDPRDLEKIRRGIPLQDDEREGLNCQRSSFQQGDFGMPSGTGASTVRDGQWQSNMLFEKHHGEASTVHNSIKTPEPKPRVNVPTEQDPHKDSMSAPLTSQMVAISPENEVSDEYIQGILGGYWNTPDCDPSRFWG